VIALAPATATVCQFVALSDTKLAGLSSLIAVAIGVAVAYLALDKLRHRHAVEISVKRLAEKLDPVDIIILRLPRLTLTEKAFFCLHYMAKTYDGRRRLAQHKEKYDDGTFDILVRFVLGALSFHQLDRWILKICAIFLCFIELSITCAIVFRNDCNNYINSTAFEYFCIILVLISYIVPCIASPVGSWMITAVEKKVASYIDDVTNSGIAGAASVAPLNPTP
jgi:hypothetical protein